MPEHRPMIVAAVQMNSTPDVAANLAAVDRLTAEAAAQGAELIGLPEAFAFIGPDREKREIVEPLPDGGAILAHCQALARTHKCHLILGGFHERSSDIAFGVIGQYSGPRQVKYTDTYGCVQDKGSARCHHCPPNKDTPKQYARLFFVAIYPVVNPGV